MKPKHNVLSQPFINTNYKTIRFLIALFLLQTNQSFGFVTPSPCTLAKTKSNVSLTIPKHNVLQVSEIKYHNKNKIHHSKPTILHSVSALASAPIGSAATRGIGSYFLVRIFFLRSLGFIFLTAFLVAYHQNKALIGSKGITPAHYILNDAEKRAQLKIDQRKQWLIDSQQYKNPNNDNKNPYIAMLQNMKLIKQLYKSKYMDPFLHLWFKQDRMNRPLITLLWLIPPNLRDTNIMDKALDMISIIGMSLSTFLLFKGAANVPIVFTLWLCQRSLMTVGGPWYGYGWEPQLAELTFHTLFLVPFLSLNPIPYETPVPKIVIWSMRWFLFRIMMGAGLIKVRSNDTKWNLNQLSTMNYFYETQPVPNPFSKIFHQMPIMWHKFEVLTNHFVELIAPWFLLIGPFLGRKWIMTAGLIQIVFQCVLISTGNLSFLNWLTMIPAIFCFDDACLSKLFYPIQTASASVASYTYLVTTGAGARITSILRKFINIVFGILIVQLSIPVIKNLCSSKQLMNASFDPLRLINTYGAFGVVNEERIELVVESAMDYKGPWKEYEFKVKPGNIFRKPRWISPYHYRLDWQMWIASSCGGIDRSPWMYTFLYKLLKADKQVIDLLSNDPWSSKEHKDVNGNGNHESQNIPKYIRVDKYRYKFNTDKREGSSYWTREKIGTFFPRQGIATLDSLKDYAQL